jgi:hypothetical protein
MLIKRDWIVVSVAITIIASCFFYMSEKEGEITREFEQEVEVEVTRRVALREQEWQVERNTLLAERESKAQEITEEVTKTTAVDGSISERTTRHVATKIERDAIVKEITKERGSAKEVEQVEQTKVVEILKEKTVERFSKTDDWGISVSSDWKPGTLPLDSKLQVGVDFRLLGPVWLTGSVLVDRHLDLPPTTFLGVKVTF